MTEDRKKRVMAIAFLAMLLILLSQARASDCGSCGDGGGTGQVCDGHDTHDAAAERGCAVKCTDSSFFSDGSIWIQCTPETVVFIQGEALPHTFFCMSEGQGFNVGECRGTDSQQVCAGDNKPELNLGPGGSVQIGGYTIYCVHGGTMNTNLDATEGPSQGNEEDCTGAGLTFTGRLCCNEADDAQFDYQTNLEAVINDFVVIDKLRFYLPGATQYTHDDTQPFDFMEYGQLDLQKKEYYYDTAGSCFQGTAYPADHDGEAVVFSPRNTDSCSQEGGSCTYAKDCCVGLYCHYSLVYGDPQQPTCQPREVFTGDETAHSFKYELFRYSDVNIDSAIAAKTYNGIVYFYGCDIYKDITEMTKDRYLNPYLGGPRDRAIRDPAKPFMTTIIYAFLQHYPDPAGGTATYPGEKEDSDAWNQQYQDPPQEPAFGATFPMVFDAPYCTLTDQDSLTPAGYYCSYLEYWKAVPAEAEEDWSLYYNELDPEKREKLKPALKWVAWSGEEFNPSLESQAECCLGTSCWDGTQCVADMSTNPNAEAVHGSYRCIDGSWVSQPRQYDWNKEKTGYCQDPSYCLVDPDGNMDYHTSHEYYNATEDSQKPACLETGQYIEDHYCENGNWTTRTRKLAESLMKAAVDEDNDNYVIHCGSYYEPGIFDVVNSIEYDTEGLDYKPSDLFSGTECEIGAYSVPCANNLCVLSVGKKRAFATTLNHDISAEFGNDPHILELFRLPENFCDPSVPTKGFYECRGWGQIPPYEGVHVYYNSSLNAIVYSYSDEGGLNFEREEPQIHTLITSFYRRLIDFILQIEPDEEEGIIDFSFVANTSRYDNIYIQRRGSRTMRGIKEVVPRYDDDAQSYIGVAYEEFTGTELCDSINTRSENTCFKDEETGTSYVIAEYGESGDSLADDWNTITASTRTLWGAVSWFRKDT